MIEYIPRSYIDYVPVNITEYVPNDNNEYYPVVKTKYEPVKRFFNDPVVVKVLQKKSDSNDYVVYYYALHKKICSFHF
jgi:hypothetical protein